MAFDMEEPVRLLMHVCCGPCAALPLREIADLAHPAYPTYLGERFDVTGLFYNPNIHPLDEFEKRKEGAIRLFDSMRLPLIVKDDFMQPEWERFGDANPSVADTGNAGEMAIASGADGDASPRCAMCYGMRIAYVAKLAAEIGFGAFTTSLLISPYQNHGLIASICESEAKLNNVRFFYKDWRPEFRHGQRQARELGLYRQKYCGCIFSRNKP